jgi:hypothetical protein
MNIKNYTSSVNADRSIMEIERILVGMGARNIAKEYDGFGTTSAIMFSIPKGDGFIPIKLPARVDAVKKLFISQYKRKPTRVQIQASDKQATMTAWRNVKEWVQLQATMIKLEQVELMEVFMPYIFRMEHGKTIFELAKENSFQKLLS